MQFWPETLASVGLSADVAQTVVDKLGHGWRVLDVRPLAGGSKDVFEMKIEGRPSLVLKVYGDSLAWTLPKEAHVAGLIGERPDVPTPRWLLVDETKDLLPRRYAVITRLEGAAMTGRFGTLEADGLYRQIGGMLRSLHQVAMPAYGYILGDRLLKAFATNLDYMAAAFDAKFADFRQQGGDGALIERLAAQVAAGRRALAGCPGPVLCHNDIHPGNVLVAQDGVGAWRVSGLVDLENATSADPLFDLAKALDQTAFNDPAGRTPLLEGYGPLDRADADAAIFVYRIYHKLEMRNWLVAKGEAPASPGPAGLLRDLTEMSLGQA